MIEGIYSLISGIWGSLGSWDGTGRRVSGSTLSDALRLYTYGPT